MPKMLLSSEVKSKGQFLTVRESLLHPSLESRSWGQGWSQGMRSSSKRALISDALTLTSSRLDQRTMVILRSVWLAENFNGDPSPY
jgi:hypothetical protein